MIEEYFYETANKRSRKPLRNVRLKRFEPAERIAPYLGMSVASLLNHAADSRTLHGIIMPDDSFILHPDGCFEAIGKQGQKYLKSLTVVPHNLRRFLKSLPMETEH
jgi:hypothetical protein